MTAPQVDVTTRLHELVQRTGGTYTCFYDAHRGLWRVGLVRSSAQTVVGTGGSPDAANDMLIRGAERR
jgi:hypothetical protein